MALKYRLGDYLGTCGQSSRGIFSEKAAITLIVAKRNAKPDLHWCTWSIKEKHEEIKKSSVSEQEFANSNSWKSSSTIC